MSSSSYDDGYAYDSESEPASSPAPYSYFDPPSPALFTLDSKGEIQLSSAGRRASLLPSSSSYSTPSVPPSYIVTPELASRLLRVYQAIEDRPLNGEKTYSRTTEMETVADFRSVLLDMLERPLQPDPLNEEILEAGRGTLTWSSELRRRLPRLPLEIHRRIAEIGPDYPSQPATPTWLYRSLVKPANKKHLTTAALVCRDWKNFAVPLLYASIDLDALDQHSFPVLVNSLQAGGHGVLVRQMWVWSRYESDLFDYFLPKAGPLPHLSSLSRLSFPFHTPLDLSELAPSLRRLEIQLLPDRDVGNEYPPFLLLPPTLNILGLVGTQGVVEPSALISLWRSFEQLSNIKTLEISNHNHNASWYSSTPLKLTSTTLGPFNYLGTRITRLILNQVSLSSSFLASLSSTYPSLLTLGLSLTNTSLPSDPSDAILSHPLLETFEVDDSEGRGIDDVVEWLKFLYHPSKNLLKVPKMGRIKIVPNFVFEYEPEIRSEGTTFEVLKGLWDMWVEVEDSRGSIWDEKWAEELEKDR